MLRRVALVRIDDSEELSASIIRVTKIQRARNEVSSNWYLYAARYGSS
jgi:hypothetical protein